MEKERHGNQSQQASQRHRPSALPTERELVVRIPRHVKRRRQQGLTAYGRYLERDDTQHISGQQKQYCQWQIQAVALL